MARRLRIESSNGFYHIRDIGINHFYVFEQAKDKQKFYKIMLNNIVNSNITIVAYCIMDNHFHILASGQKEDVSLFMKHIKEQFAQWYNAKYSRSGALFDGRYRCDVVKDYAHFWEILRYIHLNPLRAGLSKTVDDYKFCSYNCYVGKCDKLVDRRFVLSEMDETEFVAWHCKIPDFSKFENFTRHYRLTDEQAREIAMAVVGQAQDFTKMDANFLRLTIAELKRKGLSIRQISNFTGQPRWTVEKVKI